MIVFTAETLKYKGWGNSKHPITRCSPFNTKNYINFNRQISFCGLIYAHQWTYTVHFKIYPQIGFLLCDLHEDLLLDSMMC